MATITMFLTIAICTVIVLLFIYFQVKPSSKTNVTAPSILTSIGIFGTFLGIAIGLMHFNPDNIVASVPVFLSGIKLAFWSSVVGILTALLHRVRFSIRPPVDKESEAAAESELSALESLNQMRQSLVSLGTTMDKAGGRIQTDIQSMSDALAQRFDNLGIGVKEHSRLLGEELVVDDSILKNLMNLKEEMARNSENEQNAIKSEIQKVLNELIEDAKAEEQHSTSLLEAMSDLNDHIVEGSEISRKAPLQKLEHLFGELSHSATRSIDELSEVAQNLVDQAKWQNTRMAEDLIAANDSSTKSMLLMLKEILGATIDSNNKITTELAKLRTDVAANVTATTDQSKALVEQLHTMTESYKASLIATTTELKAQISKDMKASYSLIDNYTQNVAEITSHNQLEAIEKLEGVANIMQNVVTSAADMSSLLHDNSSALSQMREAFVGTSEGSLGRLLLNMNENVIAQLVSLESALEAQGSLGVLMQDLNTETSKSLRSLEKAFESSIFEVKRIPKEIVKSLKNLDKS